MYRLTQLLTVFVVLLLLVGIYGRPPVPSVNKSKRSLQTASATGSSSTTSSATTPSFTFLVRPYVPLVNCDLTNSSVTPTGYTIDLLNMIFQDLSWTVAGYQCVSEDTMYNLMTSTSNSGTYYLAEGALRINDTFMAAGISYSQPTYSSGLKAVVRQKDIRNMWSFASPISWRTGLGLLVSILVVAAIIWIFEERKWSRPRQDHLLNFVEVLYDVASSFFATNSIILRRWGSKLLQLFTWFYVIIFVAIYQADLTGKLSSSYFELEYTTFSDAITGGANIATFYRYQSIFTANYPSVNPTFYDPTADQNQTVMDMFNDLGNGVIDVIVIDIPLIEYYYPQFCNFYVLDDIIYQFSYSTAFSANVPTSWIYTYTSDLTKWQESQQIRTTKKQDFDSGNYPDCGGDSNVITIQELGGLWIILASTAGVAILIFLLKKCGFCKLRENYMPPYYEYYNEKTRLFEEQLKDAVKAELKKIAKNYFDHVEGEIESFENSLMLQDDLVRKVSETSEASKRQPRKIIPSGDQLNSPEPQTGNPRGD